MASEILSIPEEYIRSFIQVVRAGLNEQIVQQELVEYLEEWCDGEEGYLDSIDDDGLNDDGLNTPRVARSGGQEVRTND